VPHFTKSVFIRATVEKVFDFHLDPQNLARIAPPATKTELVSSTENPLQLGSHVVVRSVQAGIVVLIEAEVVVLDAPRHLEDKQIRGPFKKWIHSHTFEAREGGMQLTDDVEYELPMGGLGSLVMGRTVARELDANFDFRHQATKRMLEGE
jgi:ligand-binding SRPBCC domain-containing protein